MDLSWGREGLTVGPFDNVVQDGACSIAHDGKVEINKKAEMRGRCLVRNRIELKFHGLVVFVERLEAVLEISNAALWMLCVVRCGGTRELLRWE